MTETIWLIVGLFSGLVSIGVAVWLYLWVSRQDPGTPEAQRVASWIRQGAISYLKRLYTALVLVAVVLAVIIGIVFGISHADRTYGLKMAAAFVTGAVFSAVAGYMGMTIAVLANVRSATAAERGLNPAFNLAFRAGSVMGLAMVGIAVLGMSAIYLLTGEAEIVLGFSFIVTLRIFDFIYEEILFEKTLPENEWKPKWSTCIRILLTTLILLVLLLGIFYWRITRITTHRGADAWLLALDLAWAHMVVTFLITVAVFIV